MGARDEFPPSTKTLLGRRVAFRCSNPNCGKPTVGPGCEAADTISIGVAAHITAAAKGGCRYDEELTVEERRAAANGIWLCQNCAKLVDSDVALYSRETLLKRKRDAEDAALDALENSLHVAHTNGPALVPWIHCIEPRIKGSQQIGILCFHIRNDGLATADEIRIKLKATSTGLWYRACDFWNMGSSSDPYYFESVKGIHPKDDQSIFRLGFNDNHEEFRGTFYVSARNLPQSAWDIVFSNEEVRGRKRKDARRVR